MTNRWTFRRPVKLIGNDRLMRIVQFYVWETPVPNTSRKGKTFRELGWRGHGFLKLQAAMRDCSALTNTNWVACATKDIEVELEGKKRLTNFDCSFEFAIHTVKDGLNKTEALFYLIRNGFAHGGFRLCEFGGETFYVFESKDRSKLKGRAILREKTLLAWMQIVLEGPAGLSKRNR